MDHTELSHTSTLRFIEDNWGIAPLNHRDGSAISISSACDFTQQPLPPPVTTLPHRAQQVPAWMPNPDERARRNGAAPPRGLLTGRPRKPRQLV